MSDTAGTRLNRYLAEAGVASRRASDAVIRAGRVAVDDVTVTNPATRVGAGQRVTLDGVLLRTAGHVYVMLHKPRGVVSSVRDPHATRTVVDLVDHDARLYPVGRLDRDTTGLLLLTNDGELAARLMHPRHGVAKTYRVVVAGRVSPATAEALAAGVELDDGPTRPAQVRILRQGGRQSTIELALREGRNRQVRRMCDAVGHPVLSLARTGYGSLRLGGLGVGDWRQLTRREREALRRDAGLALPG
jgi:23S rRNA pseudouridine2605 synthase